MTVDPFHYPADARLTKAMGPAIVRRINGNRYLFTSDQQGGSLYFYRFQSGSEIAVPLGYMFRETHRGQPDNAFAIWHDTNANGTVDSGEVDTSGKPAGAPSNETYCYSVDSNGGVWTTDGSNVRCYSPQTDPNGNLYYSSSSLKTWAYPPAFVGTGALMLRAYYDPVTDSMYLAGYTTDAPKTDTCFGLIGTRIIKYTAFSSTGTQNEAYRITVPRTPGTSYGGRAMDIAGGYVAFVNGLTNNVYIYDSTTGNLLAQLPPGVNVAATGLVDCNNGLQLFSRSNGELLVFVEEDNEQKVLMHRYNPFYAEDLGTVNSGNASITSGTYTVSGATGNNFEFLCRGMTGNGTVIARVDSMAATSGSLNQNAIAGIEIRNSLDPASVYAAVLMYPTTSGGVTRWNRSTTGGSVATYHLNNVALPQWVKLVRSGSNVTAYYSSDGSAWKMISGGPVSVPLNPAVYVGLTWCSDSTTVGGAAIFDNFSSTP